MSRQIDSASIVGRITAEGWLCLDAPLLIGEGASGEARGDLDIHVLRSKEGIPFIPGTSLAGALRSFVEAEDDGVRAADILFGSIEGEGRQSAVSLYDVELRGAQIGIRDGVCIDPVTGTAVRHGKYDYEIVESGAGGSFYAEIILRRVHEGDEELLKRTLLRLRDLLRGGFHVGARTTKGFGRMHVSDMRIDCYDFRREQDVLAWLSVDRRGAAYTEEVDEQDQRPLTYAAGDFIIEADFALKGSLIVRDYENANVMVNGKKNPDALMKTSGKGENIIPGTSLKGVLRHRAAYILHALGKDGETAERMICDLMGPSPARMRELRHEEKHRSRFVAEEAIVTGVPHTQTRIRCDRFTGGTIASALFSTRPIWRAPHEEKAVTLTFGVRQMGNRTVQDWEVGLCLLLLKDLWLGRTALGGEKSIGRGLLTGLGARIYRHGQQCWALEHGVPFDSAMVDEMQEYVTALDEEAGR